MSTDVKCVIAEDMEEYNKVIEVLCSHGMRYATSPNSFVLNEDDEYWDNKPEVIGWYRIVIYIYTVQELIENLKAPMRFSTIRHQIMQMIPASYIIENRVEPWKTDIKFEE